MSSEAEPKASNGKGKNKPKSDPKPLTSSGSYHYYGISSLNNNNNSVSSKNHKRFSFSLGLLAFFSSVNVCLTLLLVFCLSLNATDEDSLRELFKPGLQSMENYDLRLGHQRVNVALDKFLGENNVKAGINIFADLKDEGFMEAVAWAACHVIRASLTLEKVGASKLAAALWCIWSLKLALLQPRRAFT